MIAPRSDLRPLAERPALILGPHHLYLGRFFRRWLRPWRGWMLSRFDRQLNRLLPRLEACRDRAELEALLGPPRFAVDGRRFRDGEGRRPDVVEHYERGGLCVEVWFHDGQLLQCTGFPRRLAWNVVCAEEYWEAAAAALAAAADGATSNPPA